MYTLDLEAQLAPKEVLRQHGRSFHFAGMFLGEEMSQRAARLYAFCRYIDDLADCALSPESGELALVKLVAELQGALSPGLQASDYLQLAQETGIDHALALQLIEGVRSDLNGVAIKDESELIRYAYRVAGVVGLMMCSVLEARSSRALPFAIDLGVAMQLTNIARDVGEDARMGRRYIPETWIGSVSPSEIRAPSVLLRESLRGCVKRMLELADRYYASAEDGLGHLPPRARFAILLAARFYWAIGLRIRQQNYETYAHRAQVSGLGKVVQGLRGSIAFVTRSRLHSVVAVHDGSLHQGLCGFPAVNCCSRHG